MSPDIPVCSDMTNIEKKGHTDLAPSLGVLARQQDRFTQPVSEWGANSFCLPWPQLMLFCRLVSTKRRRWVDVLRLGESVSIVLCRIAKQHPSDETQIESDRRPFKCLGQGFRNCLGRFCKCMAPLAKPTMTYEVTHLLFRASQCHSSNSWNLLLYIWSGQKKASSNFPILMFSNTVVGDGISD